MTDSDIRKFLDILHELISHAVDDEAFNRVLVDQDRENLTNFRIYLNAWQVREDKRLAVLDAAAASRHTPATSDSEIRQDAQQGLVPTAEQEAEQRAAAKAAEAPRHPPSGAQSRASTPPPAPPKGKK